MGAVRLPQLSPSTTPCQVDETVITSDGYGDAYRSCRIAFVPRTVGPRSGPDIRVEP
ncbi:hypothetical protein GCM10023175_08100 [Pseudonocardia xishanensis]|uniref:Uncharacterized protein n=1 Tax=Pseudonocardia xishanensis TaxID=630995 RepID=A0ABP8RHK5_9PSEU